MKLMVKILVLSMAIFASAELVFSQTKKSEDVILRAIQDEMARAMKDLKLEDFDKPYFIEYQVLDEDSLVIESKFGAILSSSRNRSRLLYTQLRVGDYEFDNVGGFGGGFRFPFPMTTDDDYEALRRAVWFVTDTSYKRAINQFAARKAAKKNRPPQDEDEKVASFSKVKPLVSIGKPGKLQIDQKKWENQVRSWSRLFRKYPELRESTVSLFIRHVNRYLINTEGTRIVEPKLLITLNIYAQAMTPDNVRLTPSRHIFAKDFSDFPSPAEVDQVISKLVQDLTKLRNAVQFKDKYIGPALFTERAAIQLFHQLLTNNLNSNGMSERLDRKVLPTFLSVIDDPTQTKFGDFKLIGDYKIDAEGVRAEPVTLIKNGVLKTLLSTRDPVKEFPFSNGRARSTGRGSNSATISNLFINSTGGKSFAELKKQLIDLCKTQGLPFGILFREIDSTFSPRGGLSVPILAYKVYVKDGREELIRGTRVLDLTVRELRHILAAGNDAHPFNILIGNGHQGRGVPVSIVAPSVLLDEVYLKKSAIKQSPTLLTHPFFNK